MENKIYEICHNLKKKIKYFIFGIILISIIFIITFACMFGPLFICIKIIGDRPVNSAFDFILILFLAVLPYL